MTKLFYGQWRTAARRRARDLRSPDSCRLERESGWSTSKILRSMAISYCFADHGGLLLGEAGWSTPKDLCSLDSCCLEILRLVHSQGPLQYRGCSLGGRLGSSRAQFGRSDWFYAGAARAVCPDPHGRRITRSAWIHAGVVWVAGLDPRGCGLGARRGSAQVRPGRSVWFRAGADWAVGPDPRGRGLDGLLGFPRMADCCSEGGWLVHCQGLSQSR